MTRNLGLRYTDSLIPTVEVVYPTLSTDSSGRPIVVHAPLHRSRSFTKKRALLKAQAWAKSNTSTR